LGARSLPSGGARRYRPSTPGPVQLCPAAPAHETFYSLTEARILIEAWRRHSNTVRPHCSLGCRPPAPEAVPSPV